MKRVYVNEEWCLGCHLCEYNCAFANSGLSDMVLALKGKPIYPRIHIEENDKITYAVSCRHCEDPICVKSCIAGALSKEDGVIRGYAYAGVFKGRAAYDRSCEMTIYLDREAAGRGPGSGRGLGRKLYEALEEELKARGILNLYACIGVPAKNAEDDEYLDHNSEQFHAHMGYTTVGRFHLCGYKFGRWYDMIWMEKMIGEHC